MDVQQPEHLAAPYRRALELDRQYPSGSRVCYRPADGSQHTLVGTIRWPWSVVGGEPVCWLPAFAGVCGVADGSTARDDLSRADRLRLLGNMVVPIQAATAILVLWERLMG